MQCEKSETKYLPTLDLYLPTTMKKTDATELKKYHEFLFDITKGPFIAYGIVAALYLYSSKGSWFSWHPFSMVVAFIAMAGNAATIKRIGGYENTKNHGYLMAGACALAAFGWYVIHTNKNIAGKMHLATLHGKIGAAVLVSYFLVGIVGAVALHPDFGFMKSNQMIRFAHKWSGRLLTAGAWTSCVLGFNTLYQDMAYRVAFTAPLLLLGFAVLL